MLFELASHTWPIFALHIAVTQELNGNALLFIITLESWRAKLGAVHILRAIWSMGIVWTFINWILKWILATISVDIFIEEINLELYNFLQFRWDLWDLEETTNWQVTINKALNSVRYMVQDLSTHLLKPRFERDIDWYCFFIVFKKIISATGFNKFLVS